MHATMYRVISHLDKPRRFASFTMDELVVLVIGLMLLISSNHKFIVGCFVVVLYSVLKHLKQGHGPKFLLIQMYWQLPSSLTEVVVSHLPPSYYRVWRA
jgi:type IV conjugative transfer system protein TraL